MSNGVGVETQRAAMMVELEESLYGSIPQASREAAMIDIAEKIAADFGRLRGGAEQRRVGTIQLAFSSVKQSLDSRAIDIVEHTCKEAIYRALEDFADELVRELKSNDFEVAIARELDGIKLKRSYLPADPLAGAHLEV